MKRILVLIFSLQLAFAFDGFNKEADECIKDNRLDADEIHRLHGSTYLPTDNNNYIIFMECLWRKIHFLDEHGELDRNTIKAMYVEVFQKNFSYEESNQYADIVMNKCKDITGPTPGLRAINMGTCLKNVK